MGLKREDRPLTCAHGEAGVYSSGSGLLTDWGRGQVSAHSCPVPVAGWGPSSRRESIHPFICSFFKRFPECPPLCQASLNQVDDLTLSRVGSAGEQWGLFCWGMGSEGGWELCPS